VPPVELSADRPADAIALTSRLPAVPADRLVAEMAPPPRFMQARFGTYNPDPEQPSQTEAVRVLEAFSSTLGSRSGRTGSHASGGGLGRRWFGRSAPAPATTTGGIYLDGGYGVGKTHLLASLWHAAPGPKAFGTFVELTNLVGALGFQQAVTALSGHSLLCIDEFELDDPGDTVLVSTLLSRLAEAGVKLAATSNTLPGKLGEGRFAAADFLREIQGLSSRFRSVRIDGQDYRHRGLPEAPPPYSDSEVLATAERLGPSTAFDGFGELLDHLAVVHPSKYGALLDGVDAVCLTGVRPVQDQSTALRLVVLADRMYDRELPVIASGTPFDEIFTDEMLNGGYRKKYLRAVSRLVALARDSGRVAERVGAV
jgi:cell division protein ZapE